MSDPMYPPSDPTTQILDTTAAHDRPLRVVTIRMPRQLHEELKHAAHDRRVSLNQLCVAALTETIGGAP